MIATNVDDTSLPTLDPILRSFSAKQLAVASTWAAHFCVPLQEQRQFIRDYLKAVSTPPVWCVTLEHNGRHVAIARFGRVLQWFDGAIIRTTTCESRYRIPKAKPGPRAVRGLANRLETLSFSTNSGLLTSFSQFSRDWAVEIARGDLGKWSKLVAGLENHSPHLRYLRPRSRYYLRMIGAALREFCRALDADILFAIRSVQCISPQLYNWLATGSKTRRLQALHAQPILLPMLILSDHRDTFPWPRNPPGFVQPIWPSLKAYMPNPESQPWTGDGNGLLGEVADNGLPLSDVLAWLLQAPKALIRYLGSCRPGRSGGALFHIRGAGHEAWGRMLQGASMGNRRPATRADWRAFYSLMEKIPYRVTSINYWNSPEACTFDWNMLLKGAPTNWNDPMWPVIEGTLTDYQEFYRHLGSGDRHASDLVTRYFTRKPYQQIANKIHQFHAYVESVQKALQQELETEEDELLLAWPALLPMGTVVCPNGITVVELQCPADLDNEHAVMKHCINTYDYSAYQGRCRLVSLRHNDRVLASAEICLAKTMTPSDRQASQQFYCVQLRGPRNLPISNSSPEGQAFRWFMQGLESGRIPSSQEWPDQTRKLRRYVKAQWAARLSEAVRSWIEEHMGDDH